MKFILLVLIGFSCGNINARLIEKVTDRPLTTETKTTGSSPPVRLTRDVYEDDSITGSSKEDNAGSDEQVRPYNRKTKHFIKSKARTDEAISLKRAPRESSEKVDEAKKNTSSSVAPAKQKSTLVKKPIPKFNEMDYDDDFQMKISRSPVGIADSSEHEDEDFNVDDYDFDVNHDEFIGRGKPLEPRQKVKATRERSNPQTAKQPASHPEPKATATPRPVSNKKERAAQYIPKKAGEKEDYYDDTTTVKVTEKEKEKPRELEDEFNDENEDSKEFDNKGSPAPIRTIRSPWKMNYMDKFGEKSSSVMAKVLSILPMFPQVPNKNADYRPAMDPWYRT